MRRLLILSAWLFTTAAHATSLPAPYPASGPWYVATTGSDSTGDGSAGNPWATIGKARDFIRTNKLNQVQRADLVVNVAAGTYRITSPIVFGKLDGGFNGHQVTYVSSGGAGAAIIDAGAVVSGWSLVSGSEFSATVPGTFWTVYENDVTSTLARTPNWSPGASFPASFAPYIATQSQAGSLTSLTYLSSDFNPATWTATDTRVRIWPSGISSSQVDWLTDTIQVSGINTGTHVISFGTLSQSKFFTFNTVGSRYFMEGEKSLVDVGGEWYLDRSGLTLFYIARDGPIASQTIVVPRTTEAIQVFGDSILTRVSNITFDGFALAHTDAPANYRSGYAYNNVAIQSPVPQPHIIDPAYDWFAAMPEYRLGAIHIKDADHITFQNMHIYDIGTNAVFAERYAQNITVQHSWIEKVGVTGIRLDGRYPGEGDYVNHNTLYDLRINNVGQVAGGGSGVEFAQSGSNTLSYSYIHDGPRKAVWMFADSILPAGYVYTCNNTVDHVLAEHTNQDSGDTGAFGLVDFSSQATSAPFSCQNTFTQDIANHTHAHASMTDAAPVGFFCDEYTNGTVFTNCQSLDSDGNGFRENLSAHQVLTNTSFLENGSQNGSFNAGLMDTANITTLGYCGAPTAPPCFPYQ